MKPNLVVIVGDVAIRYVNGKFDQKAQIDFSTGIRNVKDSIEEFRINGIGKDDEPEQA